MAAVRAASSSTTMAHLRCVERCCPRIWQAKRSDTSCSATTSSTQARRRAGFRLFPKLPPSGLTSPKSGRRSPDEAVLGVPAVVRDFRHRDGSNCFRDFAALRDQDIHLPQLGNDLFSRMLLPSHDGILHMAQSHTSGRIVFQGTGHFHWLCPITPAGTRPDHNGHGQSRPASTGQTPAHAQRRDPGSGQGL
jgi:hypothetical protein